MGQYELGGVVGLASEVRVLANTASSKLSRSTLAAVSSTEHLSLIGSEKNGTLQLLFSYSEHNPRLITGIR